MLQIGDSAPDFTLKDQAGKTHNLADYRGKTTLFYFYPKDNTPGCTAEACALRDSIEDLKQDGLTVVGISADSIDSHGKFARKYKLPFTLLADGDQQLIKAFGVWGEKSMFGKKYMGINRASFIIGPDLTIQMAWPKVSPLQHVKQVRDFLASQK